MIIIIIIALVLGVLFVMKFNKIDELIFSNKEDDQDEHFAYGIESLFFSIIMGALAGGGAFIKNMFDMDFDITILLLFTLIVIAALASYNILVSITLEHTIGRMIGKSIFLLISITLGYCIGIAGAVVILAIATLIFFLYILKTMLLGTGEKVQVEDGWGNKKTLENGFGGEFRDKWGNKYERDGNDFIQK